jgi:hypothetical protein
MERYIGLDVQRADQIGATTHGRHSRFERAFQHVAGNPGVLSYDYPGSMIFPFQYMCDSLTH